MLLGKGNNIITSEDTVYTKPPPPLQTTKKTYGPRCPTDLAFMVFSFTQLGAQGELRITSNVWMLTDLFKNGCLYSDSVRSAQR